MDNFFERWERFLDPEKVKPSLFLATMFITAFEVLKNSVIDHIRDFYSTEWNESGATISSKYQNKVLSKNKNPLYASLDWLIESGAIDESDIDTFKKLRETRNQLAHRLFDVVTGQVESHHEAQFGELIELLRKIEVWWVVNLDISINPDYEEHEIDENSIVPGSILSLQILIEVASGNTELLELWRSKHKQQKSN